MKSNKRGMGVKGLKMLEDAENLVVFCTNAHLREQAEALYAQRTRIDVCAPAQLVRAFEQLPPRQRKAFALIYMFVEKQLAHGSGGEITEQGWKKGLDLARRLMRKLPPEVLAKLEKL